MRRQFGRLIGNVLCMGFQAMYLYAPKILSPEFCKAVNTQDFAPNQQLNLDAAFHMVRHFGEGKFLQLRANDSLLEMNMKPYEGHCKRDCGFQLFSRFLGFIFHAWHSLSRCLRLFELRLGPAVWSSMAMPGLVFRVEAINPSTSQHPKSQ